MPPWSAVSELAGQIAANAPLAVQFAKSVLDAGQGDGQPLALEGLASALLATTDDGQEGPASFREKRPPHFRGH